MFKALFLFSALNSEEPTHSGTPKVRLAAKNVPFLHKTSTTLYVEKTTLFYAFCVLGCVASYVESDPPGADLENINKTNKQTK